MEDSQFTDLYRAHAAPLARYVARIVGDANVALDITHDTLTKAYEHELRAEPGEPPIGAWLYRVARNAALDHLRRTRRARLEEPSAIARRRERTEAAPLNWGSTTEIHAELALLPAAQRDVTLLRYREGLSPTETGTSLGKTAAAVRQLELRALRSLRAALLRPTP